MNKKNNLKERNPILKILFFLLIVGVFAYFLIGQLFNFDSILIGGPKYLLIEDNFLSVGINRSFSKLELFFREPVRVGKNNEVLKQKNSQREPIKAENYTITSSTDNKAISVNIKEDINGTIYIKINFSALSVGGFPKKKYIKNVILDGNEIGLTKFFNSFIDQRDGNIEYYKSFDLKNISSILAEQYGSWLFYTVSLILVVLLTIQFIVFFVTVIESFFSEKAIKIGENAIFPLNLIDTVSRDFSVFLGFLGTIVSIWTALEISDFDYSNFFQILGIIKMAVFTTVLGLLVRILYSIREFVFNLRKN
jgi:hypothetical protein